MHTKIDNAEIRIGDDTNDVAKELFKFLLQRCQENLHEKMRAVKRLSGLLRGVTSNNNSDFYCLNCFCSYRTKNKLDLHKKVCQNRDYCQVDEESSTTEINKHTPSGYSLFTNCSFDERKNKLDYYRGEDCMKKFCKDLRKHATQIISCNKKK